MYLRFFCFLYFNLNFQYGKLNKNVQTASCIFNIVSSADIQFNIKLKHYKFGDHNEPAILFYNSLSDKIKATY